MSIAESTTLTAVPAPFDRVAAYRPAEEEWQAVRAANDVNGPARETLTATGCEPSSEAWKRAKRAVEQTSTYTAGVYAWRSWLARTCPSWCTDDHRREYPHGRINFEASHGMTVGAVGRGDHAVEVEIGVCVGFFEEEEFVREPALRIGVDSDDQHTAAQVSKLIDLVTRAQEIVERIERGEKVAA